MFVDALCSRSPHRALGLTLVELLVALAIGGILLATASPQLSAWLAERELQDRADALLHTLSRARTEAVKRGTRVNVCPQASGACPGPAAPWEAGWAVLPDAPPGAEGTPASLFVERAASSPITIRGNRPVADYVSYTTLGHARRLDGSLQMGTFVVCRSGHNARKVVVANSGRARVERTTEACP